MYLIKNLYEEHHSKESLKSLLDSLVQNGTLKFYAFILHNKDIAISGDLKKPHYHLIVDYNSTSHHAKNDLLDLLFDLHIWSNKNQAMADSCRSLSKSMRYLTHKDNKEKAPYDDLDVITSDYDLYYEFCQKQISESETDIILDYFLTWCKDNEMYYWNELEVLSFFKNLGKLSFYMRNRRNLLEIGELYFRTYNKFIKNT